MKNDAENIITERDYELLKSLYIHEQKQRRHEAEYLLNHLWRKQNVEYPVSLWFNAMCSCDNLNIH